MSWVRKSWEEIRDDIFEYRPMPCWMGFLGGCAVVVFVVLVFVWIVWGESGFEIFGSMNFWISTWGITIIIAILLVGILGIIHSWIFNKRCSLEKEGGASAGK